MTEQSDRRAAILVVICSLALSAPMSARAARCMYGMVPLSVTQLQTCPGGLKYANANPGMLTIRCSDGAVDPIDCSFPPSYAPWTTAGAQSTCDPIVTILDDCDTSFDRLQCRYPERNTGSCAGDPVDLTSGQLEREATDLDPGRGLAFTRRYASSNAATGSTMGPGWRHDLDWKLAYSLVDAGTSSRPKIESAIITQPSGGTDPFLRITFPVNATPDPWKGGSRAAGGLSGDPTSAFVYTDDEGLQVFFNGQTHALEKIQLSGAPPVVVSHAGNVTTFTRGDLCLRVTEASGRVESVASRPASSCASGSDIELWTYGYDANGCLRTVEGWNPSDPTEPVSWAYTYHHLDNDPANPCTDTSLTKIERAVDGAAYAQIAEWTWSAGANPQVISIDEPQLDQALSISYPDSTTTEVREAPAGALLATLSIDQGRISSASGSGGPGFYPPFGEADVTAPTTTGSAGGYWKTKTDLNGNTTLYEAHDARGRPGRIVDDWVDGESSGTGHGELSSADTYARRRDYTYHPSLEAPLSITEESVLNSSDYRVETFDYDADLDSTPNEAPTDLLHRKVLTGLTLDASGAPVEFTDATTYTYDSNARLTQIAGPRSAQLTTIAYDATSGSRSSIRRYLNGTGSSYLEWTFSNFDEQGNPETVTDPNGRATTFTYDALGRVLTAKPPCEASTCTGANDTTVIFQYDVDGNLTKVTFPDDTSSNDVYLSFGYDPTKPDLLRFIADSQANAIVYTYEKGRTTREERYTGFADLESPGTQVGDASFEYNAAGRLLHAFNPLFPNAEHSGDVLATFDYDAKGNLTSVEDENGRDDGLEYDALDRLEKISQVRTATYETEFEYDALSNVTGVTDAASKSTDLLHDDRGNLVETVSPDTGRTRFVYDAAGNLETKIENAPESGSGGRTTSYTYDGLDRLTAINLANDADWTFTYDTSATTNQKGRLAQVTNGTVTTKFEYTKRGNVKLEQTIIDGFIYNVSYTYDAAGNRSYIEVPSATNVTTSHAGLRPSSLAITGGSRTEVIDDLAWYPFGPRTEAKLPPDDINGNTVTSSRTVNLRGQITELDVSRPGLTLLDRSYTYDFTTGTPGPNDPGPNLDKVVDHLDATESRFFFYDELDRVKKATDLAGAALHEYGYDAVGNRTEKTDGGAHTAYAYESLGGLQINNRLDSATGAEATDYAHDVYGNRIYGTTADSSTASMVYDEVNRLIEVRDPDDSFSTVATYSYDAFGRRVKKVAGTTTVLFFYDTEGHLLEEIQKVSDAADLVRTYVYLEDELVQLVDKTKEVGTAAWVAPGGSTWEIEPPLVLLALALFAGIGVGATSRRWPVGIATTASGGALLLLCAGTQQQPRFAAVHVDPLGTPLAVTNVPATWTANNQAKVIWRAKYEPYGKALVNGDPDGDTATFSLSVRFPGQYEDAETGWYFNLNRYFDPAVGSYTQPDPTGLVGGLQIYSYAKSDPINLIDRFGLESSGGSSPSMNWMRPLARIPRFGNPLRIFFDAGDAKLPFAGTPADQDAFRHCLASCEAQRQYGSDVTAYLDELNELKGGILGNQTAGDRQMDEINNAIGRSLVRFPLSGRECSNCKYECELAVRQQVLTTVLFGRGQRYRDPESNQ